MDQPNPQDGRKKVWELIRDIRVALMVTHDGKDGLRARPMGAISPELQDNDWNGELWFFTTAGSPKLAEIEKNDSILLSYAYPPRQDYVSISGKAKIVRDRAMIEKLWSEPLRVWFPKGKQDPEIALIHVEAEGAEYWDSPSSVVVYALGYLKARITGERADPGENAKVKFQTS